MTRTLRYFGTLGPLIAMLCCMAALLMPQSAAAKTADVDSLWRAGSKQLSSNNPNEALKYADELDKIDSPRAKFSYHIIMGQAMIQLDNSTEAYRHLREAEILQKTAGNDSLRASTFNGLGIYTINVDNDPNHALEYFFKALEHARKAQYNSLYALLLGNIASVYYLKEDPSGLEYALECYEIGRERNNSTLMFIGALETSNMQLLAKNGHEAMHYAKLAAKIAESEPSLNYKAEAYVRLGSALDFTGEHEAALEMHQKALKDASANPEISIRARLGMAEALKNMKRYREAENVLVKALDISYTAPVPLFCGHVLLALSELCELQGNLAGALDYYRKYSQCSDSVAKDINTKTLHEARAKFDLERKENELNRQRMANLQKQRTLYVLVSIVLLVATAATLLMMMYRRKSRLYKAIVAQNRQRLANEENLRSRITELEKEKEMKAESKYVSSSLSTSKSKEIIERLEHLMSTDRPYTDSLLNKDKLAALLQTNRSYLSQIINDTYGISVTQYINNYRIAEAVKLLSQPDCDVPLKQLCADLGFNSISTFYSQFKEATGMTPSVYRKNARS